MDWVIKESHSEEVTSELTPKIQKRAQPWKNEICFPATSVECFAKWFWFDLVWLICQVGNGIDLICFSFSLSEVKHLVFYLRAFLYLFLENCLLSFSHFFPHRIFGLSFLFTLNIKGLFLIHTTCMARIGIFHIVVNLGFRLIETPPRPFSLSSPIGTLIMCILVCLKVSYKFFVVLFLFYFFQLQLTYNMITSFWISQKGNVPGCCRISLCVGREKVQGFLFYRLAAVISEYSSLSSKSSLGISDTNSFLRCVLQVFSSSFLFFLLCLWCFLPWKF